MSKTSWRVKENYNQQHYSRFFFQIPQDIGDSFRRCAKDSGYSMSMVIACLMLEFIRRYDVDEYQRLHESVVPDYLERNVKR